MHGVPRFMREGVDAVDVVVQIVHQDKWIGIVTTGGVGATSFAFILITVQRAGRRTVD